MLNPESHPSKDLEYAVSERSSVKNPPKPVSFLGQSDFVSIILSRINQDIDFQSAEPKAKPPDANEHEETRQIENAFQAGAQGRRRRCSDADTADSFG